jgi:hypothetical protein
MLGAHELGRRQGGRGRAARFCNYPLELDSFAETSRLGASAAVTCVRPIVSPRPYQSMETCRAVFGQNFNPANGIGSLIHQFRRAVLR